MEENIRVHVVEYPDRQHLVLRYRDPITGRHKTKSAKTAKRKDAEKAAAVWEAELQSGRYSSPSKTTWADFRERYEVEVVTAAAPRTMQQVGIVLDMVERMLNPAKVRDITAQKLSWLAAELRKDTKQGDKTKIGLAESSIKSYFAHLKASLRWAERVGLIVKAPSFPKPQRCQADAAKGRAISGEEFDRMLAAVPKVVNKDGEHPERVDEWKRYLRGLWLSGFRVGESLLLSWDEGSGIIVDIGGRNPVAHIQASAQKSNRTETLPLAPEFGEFLAETPNEARSGYVFNPLNGRGKRTSLESAIRTVSAIGRQACVKTWTNPKSKASKCATAHDLRRSFGTRWASLVMPAVLQTMMRHASIQTTMSFYVTRNAVAAGDIIREAFQKGRSGTNLGTTPLEAQEKSTHKNIASA